MADEKDVLLRVEIDRSEAQKGLEDTTRQLLENKKAVADLNAAYKTGQVSTDQYVREQIRLKREQQSIGSQQKEYTKQLDAESNSLNALRLRLAALTKERNSVNQGTKEGVLRAKELTEEIKNTSDAIKEQEEAGGDFRRNVGNYGSAFQEAVGGVQVFGTSLDGLFKLILTNPIGLIITALFALGKALTQNDTIATALKGVMTGLGVVIDNVAAFVSAIALQFSSALDSTSEFTTFIKDVAVRVLNNMLAPLQFILDILPAVSAAMEGDFSEAADIAAEASTKFGKSVAFMNTEVPQLVKNIGAAIDVGLKYEATLDIIEAKQSKLNVTTARMENIRDRLELQAKDLSRSEEERIALANKALSVDRQILKQRQDLLDEEIKAQSAYVQALGKDSLKREEAEFRLNDLQVQRLQLQNESLKFEEGLINERNSLIESQIAAEKKRAEEEERSRQKKIEDDQKLIDRSIAGEQKLEEFRLEQAAKRAETIDEELERLLELEDFKVEVQLEKENLLASEKLFIIEKSEAKKADLVKAAEEKKRQEVKKTAELETQVQNQKLGMAANVFDTLSTLAAKGSQEQKALASVAALINTYQGVSGALANSAPPPVGLGPVGSLVSAGVILAQGLAQVAGINAAAGGGDFVTTKPTLLLVGDNPGGRERVTVEPLSGKGKTKIFKDSGMIAMAGGGTLTTGAAISRTISSPISDSFSQTNTIIDALTNMPAPVVSVKEVVKTTQRVNVKQSVKSL